MDIDDAIRIARQTLRARCLGIPDLCDALGIPNGKRAAVQSHGCLGALVGVLPIQPQGQIFDVVEGGELSAIACCYWLGTWPIDLVAIRLDKPQQSYRLLGIADALGEQAIERARCYSTPLLKNERAVLTVHETPLDWLRSGCEGACVLDPRRIPAVLSDIDAYQTTKAFAPRLHKLLRQAPPNIGEVLVPAESIAA